MRSVTTLGIFASGSNGFVAEFVAAQTLLRFRSMERKVEGNYFTSARNFFQSLLRSLQAFIFSLQYKNGFMPIYSKTSASFQQLKIIHQFPHIEIVFAAASFTRFVREREYFCQIFHDTHMLKK